MIFMQEEAHHAPHIQALHTKAFPEGRKNGVSAYLRRAHRSCNFNTLAILTRRGPELAGAIQGYILPGHMVLVSPLAVAPEAQGLGLGGLLLEKFCGLAKAEGFGLVVLKSKSEQAMRFYAKHGFEKMQGLHWPCPNEAPLTMVRELTKGALRRAKGQVVGGLQSPRPNAITEALRV